MKTMIPATRVAAVTATVLLAFGTPASAQGTDNAVNLFETLGSIAGIGIFIYLYYLIYSFLKMILGEENKKIAFIAAGIFDLVLFAIAAYYLFYRSPQ